LNADRRAAECYPPARAASRRAGEMLILRALAVYPLSRRDAPLGMLHQIDEMLAEAAAELFE
jgi:hypothetical protein